MFKFLFKNYSVKMKITLLQFHNRVFYIFIFRIAKFNSLVQLVSKFKQLKSQILKQKVSIYYTQVTKILVPHMIRTQKTGELLTSISFLISEFQLHSIHLMPHHVSFSSLWRPEHKVQFSPSTLSDLGKIKNSYL